MRSQRFSLDSIIIVAQGESFRDEREPPHRIGDIVRLNSGGPPSLILDLEDDRVTIGWRSETGSIEEATFPEICVHRSVIISKSFFACNLDGIVMLGSFRGFSVLFPKRADGFRTLLDKSADMSGVFRRYLSAPL